MTSPIFIVGAPRSGTTLLSSMLSAHPSIAISTETGFMSHWYTIRHWYGDLNVPRRFDAFWIDYTTQGRFADVDVDADCVLERIRQAAHVDLRMVFAATMEEYAAKVGKPRWGEKSPGHEFYIETLLDWYPEAKILFVVRDPRAVFASMLRVPWGKKDICWQMGIWKTSIRFLENARKDPRVAVARYEDLVQEPIREMHRLCEFIGEEYTDGMIYNRSETSSPISDAVGKGWTREHLQSTLEKPITTASMNKWRSQLTLYQIAAIERTTEREMREFQYQRAGRRFTAGQFFYWYFIEKPVYSARRYILVQYRRSKQLFRLVTPFSMMRWVRKLRIGSPRKLN